jgi:hypothetical protein
VAVGVAILIFFTGYEIAKEALRGEGGSATVHGWMLDTLDRRAARPQARGGTGNHDNPATSAKGSGHQHRHRQRRGGGSR